MNNLLIVFEGLDGSGKTTQINLLKEWFEKKDLPVYLTKQPTDFYREDPRVRDYLDNGIAPNMYSIALLAAADRTYQMEYEIRPLLEKTNIISDRYLYSSLAFFKARGIDYDEVNYINKNIVEPDVVIFLDIPPEESLKRVYNRDGENIKFEEKSSEIFTQVRENFLNILPEKALIVNSKLGIENVHKVITKHIEKIIIEKYI